MTQKKYSPLDSSTWHNRFSKEDLQWSDLKRTGKIIVPIILLVFLIIIYLIVYIAIGLSNPKMFFLKFGCLLN